MDVSSLGTATLSGVSLATIFAVVLLVYKCVNHKEIRSRCCGRTAVISLDINETPHPTVDQSRTSTAERAALASDIIVRVPTTI